MEYSPFGVSAAPGQLWRNVRTGDVLFVYKKQSRLEGVLCDGRRINDLDVVNLVKDMNGWKCVYVERPGQINYDLDES